MTREQQLLEELRRRDDETESLRHAISHELRAPLRSITGFSLALLEDEGHRLDAAGRAHLERVCDAAKRMDRQLLGLIELLRVSRAEERPTEIDLSRLADDVVEKLRAAHPDRDVETVVGPAIRVHGDPALLRVVVESLLDNAWKFTSKRPRARIEIGMRDGAVFVCDDGAGFDPDYSNKLFHLFQRLHPVSEFEGTGTGLAIARRIIERHGGRMWAEGHPGEGATFYFSLPPATA
jgi:light-regulated signal transduction histidine kinase (bacteriophytochrome)